MSNLKPTEREIHTHTHSPMYEAVCASQLSATVVNKGAEGQRLHKVSS